MLSIKSEREIELMRQAGDIVARCLDMIQKEILPGVSTLQLNSKVEKFIVDNGAKPSFKGLYGFRGSACISVNSEVVHGIPKASKVLKDGDIVTIDCGANVKNYHADGAWTFVVGESNLLPKGTAKLLEVTEKSLQKGIEQVKPGNCISDISLAIQNYVNQFGYGIIEELSGHGIGSKVHEAPNILNYVERTEPKIILKPGMTFCIEPMITQGSAKIFEASDKWTILTRDNKNSAHFEHTILVTQTGYEILTKIKKIGEI